MRASDASYKFGSASFCCAVRQGKFCTWNVLKVVHWVQSQPLPAIDDRLDLAAMGKFNSVPMFGQVRRRSIGRPARHSIDLASSLAAVAAPVAADNMLDSYDFLAGGTANPPPRYSQREEAAYKAGIAAAMAAQNQQEQQQAQAAEFMQSLQQAARAQAAAAEAESAAAAQLHPCAGFLGETGAFGSSPFHTSPFGAAGSFAPQQPAMCAITDTGTWTYEAEGALQLSPLYLGMPSLLCTLSNQAMLVSTQPTRVGAAHDYLLGVKPS
jgi:hypothetical protein